MADDDDKDLEREDDDSDESTSDDSSSDTAAAPRKPVSSVSAGSDDADDGGQDDDAESRELAREEREIAREERELAEGGSEHDVAPITGLLGVERWVQFSFIALALVFVFVADQLMSFAWQFWAEPDSTIVSGSAALIGILGAFALYRHPRVNELAHEVVSELSKVTWPTRDETYYSTLVVIVTSVIAAVYTGVFDALWSAFTDLIYNV